MISTQPVITVTYDLVRRACNPVVLLLVVFCILLAIPAQIDAKPRIVAFGDSLTTGYGVDPGDGLVPQLQSWLDAHGAGGFEVVNQGVSGDTTAGGVERLDWALAGGTKAVVLELGANDMLRGVAPSETRKNLEALLAEFAARDLPVLLVGMRATPNFGPDYKREFDDIFPNLAKQYGTLFDPFFFEGLIGEAAYFQADGLHLTAAGVSVVVERLGPLVLELIARIEPGPKSGPESGPESGIKK
jgi:acyl-CoA thioesterase-1